MKQTVNETALIYENKERIKVLEAEILHIKTSVDKIMNNHLVHVEDEIRQLREEFQSFRLQMVKEMTQMATKIAIIVSVGSLFINFVIERFVL